MFGQKKGLFYFENNDDLSIDYSKGWFIVSQLYKKDMQSEENLERIKKLSNIRRNTKLYECSYEASIEKQIKDIEKENYINGKNFIH
jgi:hypothetical protein